MTRSSVFLSTINERSAAGNVFFRPILIEQLSAEEVCIQTKDLVARERGSGSSYRAVVKLTQKPTLKI